MGKVSTIIKPAKNPPDSGARALAVALVIVAVLLHRAHVSGLLDVSVFVPPAVTQWLGMGGGVCGLLPHVSFTLTSTRVLLDDGVHPGAVLVEYGQVTRVERLEAGSAGGKPSAESAARAAVRSSAHVVDFGDAVISPGVIDVHVHMDEPGREEWEGAVTGTRAAAAGGVTTIVDMPLNSAPATTTAAILRDKIAALKGKAMVDVGFWGGMVPANSHDADELRAMLKAGALGFKSFLSPSGINDFPNATIEDVAAALPVFRTEGVPFLVHAELLADLPTPTGDPRKYATFLATRPKSFEAAAIRALITELRKAEADQAAPAKQGFGLHIAHLANADMLPEIAAAKAKGLPLTTEVCAHHLTWDDKSVPDGGTIYKCMPPLRDRSNLEGLWEGLKDGTIDMVSSDHSPSTPDLKLPGSGDFLKAWGGIAGLQYTLPALHSGMAARGIPLARGPRWWATAAAKLTNLHARKGRLAPGFDADIVVWAPEEKADTSAEGCHQKHKNVSYVGADLSGRVLATFVRGQQVFGAAKGFSPKPCGALVLRT